MRVVNARALARRARILPSNHQSLGPFSQHRASPAARGPGRRDQIGRHWCCWNGGLCDRCRAGCFRCARGVSFFESCTPPYACFMCFKSSNSLLLSSPSKHLLITPHHQCIYTPTSPLDLVLTYSQHPLSLNCNAKDNNGCRVTHSHTHAQNPHEQQRTPRATLKARRRNHTRNALPNRQLFTANNPRPACSIPARPAPRAHPARRAAKQPN